MPITVIPQKNGSRYSVRRDWTRTYKRTWKCVVTDAFGNASGKDIPQTIANSLPVGLGDFYTNSDDSEFDGGSFCCQIDVDPEGATDGASWIAVATYEPYDPVQFPENPLLTPLEIEGGFNPYETIIDRDQTGAAVVNSTGDPFDPPLTSEDPRPSLTIVRNEATIDWGLLYMYRNAVNSDFFWGAPPTYVKVSRIAPKRMWNQYLANFGITPGGFYWSVTYEFQFNPQGWHAFVLDQGMRKLVMGKPQQIAFNGIPITSPALLDGAGGVLPASGTPVFKEFIIYPELAFEIFNLNNPGP
jgi:hypothetical protein